MRLTSAPDGDEWIHELVCDQCGERSRLHPHEGLVSQVRVFNGQHRHDDHPAGGGISRAAPGT